MEDPQPQATTQDPGVAPAAQPEEQPAAAVITDSEPTTTPDQQPAAEPGTPAPSDDEDLTDYWAKKGIDITTPEGQAKAAKSYREAERAMHNKAQQASELSKQINTQPLNVDTDNELVRQALDKASQLETTLTVQQWKASNNISPEQDAALGQYVIDNPNLGVLLKNGYLNLDQLYAMSGVGTVDTSAAKKQGSKEALQDIANQQRTTAISGAATTAAPQPKEDVISAVWSNDD
jgi:hypothetical protein